jgi:hypothetical protein
MWQNKRKGKFTASEIYKLFVEPKTTKDKNLGIWSDTAMSYIFEKAVEETTGYRKQFTSMATEHGVVNEYEAFEAFEKLTNMGFALTSTTYFPINEISGASPDGVLYDDNDFSIIKAVMDVKCPYNPVSFFEQKRMFMEAKEYQGVPKSYYYQMQMQMMATGSNVGYLVRYLTSSHTDDFGNKYEFDIPIEGRIFWSEITRDEFVNEQIMERIEKAEETKQQIIQKIIYEKVNPIT